MKAQLLTIDNCFGGSAKSFAASVRQSLTDNVGSKLYWGNQDTPNMNAQPKRRRRRSADGPDVDCPPLTPRQAGAKIFETILDMYSQCSPVSAKDVCTLFYYLNISGVEGAYFNDYGMAPGHQSGKYKHHLDRMLPRACPTIKVGVPSYVRGQSNYATRKVPFMLTYASLVKEMKSSPDVLETLENGDYDNPDSPMNLPCYTENKLTTKAVHETGRNPLPLAVYMDGVRFTALQAGRSDSILVATLVNLLTQKRHVVGLIRQLDMCRCGCNGWCTVHVFLSYIAWIVGALVDGRVPERKWDGTEWKPDEDRALHNGEVEFGFRAMLLYVKGDWSEFAKTFGLGSWGKSLNPCPLCFTDKACMHDSYADMCEGGVLFSDRQLHDYECACQKCEHRVAVNTEAVRERIVGALHYNKSKRGKANNGRALKYDLPELSLKQADRLEPHKGMSDIRQIDEVGWTGIALFWRVTKDHGGKVCDSVSHRCPLFKEEWGTSPATSMAVDSLHTVYYGPMSRISSAGLWRLIQLNPWNYAGDREAIYTQAVQRIEADMFRFFDETNVPNDRRLGALTLKMLGPDRGMMDEGGKLHPGAMLKAKAAETHVLMNFTKWEIRGSGQGMVLKGPLLKAMDGLSEWLDVYDNANGVLTDPQYQKGMDSCRKVLLYSAKAKVSFVPKFHLFSHATIRTPRDKYPDLAHV